MKILVICPLTSNSGGAVTSWSISEQLGKLGHEVCFTERSWRNESVRNSHSVKYLRSLEVGSFLPLNILISTLFNILVVLRFKPDVVFVLKPLPNGCVGALLGRLLGAKTILHINDLDHEFYEDGFLRKVSTFFYKFFPKLFNRISFASLKLKEHVQQELDLTDDQVFLLLQGVDCSKFEQIPQDEDLRGRLGLTGNKIIVYVASFGITSDFKSVTDIFIQISKVVNNVKFLVIGGGSSLEMFKQQVCHAGIGDLVVFTDYIDHKEMEKYLSLGDVGINYMEDKKVNRFRIPIKVKEYLAAGLEVVTNNVGDYYMLENHISITNNEDEFVRAVKKICDNTIAIDMETKKGIVEFYDWRQIIKTFDATLLSLVART